MKKPKKDSKGFYHRNVVIGRRPDGSYIRKNISAKTLRELESKTADVMQLVNQGLHVWEGTMTFKELADIWLNDYHGTETPRWLYSQDLTIKKHLLPTLGGIMVKDIRQIHLQTIITSLSQQGYATETMKKIKHTAERIMKVAVGSDIILRNPFSEIRIPRKDPDVRRALTDQEIGLITDTWRGHNLGIMAMIMLYAGLRKGEATALEWEDISFDERLIHITKATCSLKNTATIKKPKTKAGTRAVPIPRVLLEALIEKRKPSGYVCTSAGGGFLTDSSFKRQWASYLHYLNICAGGQNGAGPYIHRIDVIDNITAHMLRHTYATMLFDANVDIKSAQRFLGHEDVQVTLAIYTHLTKYKEDQAIKALNEHLDEKIVPQNYIPAGSVAE